MSCQLAFSSTVSVLMMAAFALSTGAAATAGTINGSVAAPAVATQR